MGMAENIRYDEQDSRLDAFTGKPEDVKNLSLFMEIGAMMIRNGSEVKRVEAYGSGIWGSENGCICDHVDPCVHYEYARRLRVLNDQRNERWHKDGLLEA